MRLWNMWEYLYKSLVKTSMSKETSHFFNINLRRNFFNNLYLGLTDLNVFRWDFMPQNDTFHNHKLHFSISKQGSFHYISLYPQWGEQDIYQSFYQKKEKSSINTLIEYSLILENIESCTIEK